MATVYHWHAVGLLVNGFASLVLVIATLSVAERWRRYKSSRLQFSLSTILAFTYTAAVMLASVNVIRLRDLPWFLLLPILFAFGCAIYTAGWLATRLAGRCFRFVSRRFRRSPGGST